MEINVCPRWLLARLPCAPEARIHVAFLVSSLIAIVAAPLLVRLPHFCLAETLLHIPCPGCGVLHSIIALLHGRLGDAWQSNPAGIAVAGAFVFQLAARPLAIARANARSAVAKLSRWTTNAATAVLFIVWISKLLSGGN